MMTKKAINRESIPIEEVLIRDLDEHTVIDFNTINTIQIKQTDFAVLEYDDRKVEFVIDKEVLSQRVFRSPPTKSAYGQLRKLNNGINENLPPVYLKFYSNRLAETVKMLLDRQSREAVSSLKAYFKMKSAVKQRHKKNIYYGTYIALLLVLFAALLVSHFVASIPVVLSYADLSSALVVSAYCGLLGGLFSMLTNRHGYSPSGDWSLIASMINALSRAFVAAVAALIMGLLFGFIYRFAASPTDSEDSRTAFLMLLCFFSGMSERIVPFIVKTLNKHFSFVKDDDLMTGSP